MTIYFYKFVGDFKTANKAPLLGTGHEVTGTLRHGCDVLRPQIFLEQDVRGYNYCYIPDFGRYYWVKEYPDVMTNSNWIALEVDPLTSWWTGLQECRCRVAVTADKDNMNRNIKSTNVAIQQFTIPWNGEHGVINEEDAGLGIDNNYVVVGIYG